MAYISGKDTKKWAPYAGKNSYHADKAQLRHDLGTEGCKANLNAKYEGDRKEAKARGALLRHADQPGGHHLHRQGRK
jgi:hypothetical protein